LWDMMNIFRPRGRNFQKNECTIIYYFLMEGYVNVWLSYLTRSILFYYYWSTRYYCSTYNIVKVSKIFHVTFLCTPSTSSTGEQAVLLASSATIILPVLVALDARKWMYYLSTVQNLTLWHDLGFISMVLPGSSEWYGSSTGYLVQYMVPGSTKQLVLVVSSCSVVTVAACSLYSNYQNLTNGYRCK